MVCVAIQIMRRYECETNIDETRGKSAYMKDKQGTRDERESWVQKEGIHYRRRDKEENSQQKSSVAVAVTISCTKATLILILISSNKNRIFSIFGTVHFIQFAYKMLYQKWKADKIASRRWTQLIKLLAFQAKCKNQSRVLNEIFGLNGAVIGYSRDAHFEFVKRAAVFNIEQQFLSFLFISALGNRIISIADAILQFELLVVHQAKKNLHIFFIKHHFRKQRMVYWAVCTK